MFGSCLAADEVSALVMDMGTTCTKVGYAGEDCPKYVIPSSVGVVGGEGAADKASFRVGTNALGVRADGLRIQPAVVDGVVQNWDAAEAILEHAYKHSLSCDASDHPLLMAEASHNPPAAREKMAELVFEKFGVPAFFLSKNAVLTAFASGRGTALVLDVGGGVTSAAAVHDGYVLSRSVRRHALAGDLINEMLLKSAQLRNPPPPLLPLYSLKRTEVGPGEFSCSYVDYPGTHPSFHKYHLLQILRDAKENACRCNMVAPTEAYPIDTSKWDFEMPDRSTLDVAWERCHIPELLFNPSLLRTTPPPWLREGASPSAAAGAAELAGMVPENVLALPELVAETIRGCDTDMRRELWGSIIVSGGCSLLPGLTERLHGRLNELVPQMSMKVKLLAPSTPQERRFSVWIGGSILGSLGSFQQMWMSKAEYEELGASGIQRKCP
jgi:actin-like protein 6A